MPVWMKQKMMLRKVIRDELYGWQSFDKKRLPLLFCEHHLSHAASAFYVSPYEEAAILTIDGVGEWATTVIGKGSGKEISFEKEVRYPHSLGLLYSAATYYCGFKVNSGEYKLMGLAPYGDEQSAEFLAFREKITRHLVTIYEDGSFFLHQEYFHYLTGLRMTNDKKWEGSFRVSAPGAGVFVGATALQPGAGISKGDGGYCPAAGRHGTAANGHGQLMSRGGRSPELCRQREDPGRGTV
jgi:carbamoyltransferase